MKVAHFNTFLTGGAATAVLRIHEGLLRNGKSILASELYHRQTQSNSEGGKVSAEPRHIKPLPIEPNRLSRFQTPIAYRKYKQRQYAIYEQYNTQLANRSSTLETFAMAELPESTKLQWSSIKADVAHLHWISFLADYPSFFSSIPAEVPIVWTLHDMNPFTGGCHYADECLRYRSGCGICPQVLQPRPNDVSSATIKAKQHALSRHNITVVSPSHWLKDQARQSPVWPSLTDFHVIPYGLDLEQYSPMDKQQARQELGIRSDAFLIGFGAADLSTPRKGMKHLLNAMKLLHGDRNRPADVEIEGLLFGGGKAPELEGLPPMHVLGFVESVAQQRRVFSAADVVILTSREDNQPQVGLESLACGTPVIGFSSGGIPEFVRDGKTGLLVEPGNDNELAAQIRRLIADADLRNRLAVAGRKMMEAEFEITRQSGQYIQLYQAVLNQHRAISRQLA